MKTLVLRFANTALLSLALLGTVSVTPTLLHAADHNNKKWHDNARNEDHEWNSHEDKAYRMWVKEDHRKYKDFGKLKEEDRQRYWAWRHDHSDALLKIDIR
jgi:hypothetical protein